MSVAKKCCLYDLSLRRLRIYKSCRKSLLAFLIAAFGLLFLLTACGSTDGPTAGGGGTATPTSAPTQTYSVANGCPSNATMNTDTVKPDKTIQIADANGPIVVHNGDVFEVRLPFGSKWSGPTVLPGVLQLQGPAGYALKSAKMCVWSYVAKGTGTATLQFSKSALCKPGQLCPMHIMDLPFVIKVQ